MLKKLMPALALATAALSATQPAFAQSASTYPNKPIHIIVTFTSGGAPDILGRLIGDKLSAAWGQTVIVENKPGAGGNIGADYVAKSAPDGYNIVVGTVGTHAINGALYQNMPYEMTRDFTPVTLLASTPNMLVVNNNVPAKNLKEFIDLGKKEGKMTFASSGSVCCCFSVSASLRRSSSSNRSGSTSRKRSSSA